METHIMIKSPAHAYYLLANDYRLYLPINEDLHILSLVDYEICELVVVAKFEPEYILLQDIKQMYEAATSEPYAIRMHHDEHLKKRNRYHKNMAILTFSNKKEN